MWEMPLYVRKWHCPERSAGHDRDINAARNINVVGLVVSAHGELLNKDRVISGKTRCYKLPEQLYGGYSSGTPCEILKNIMPAIRQYQ